MSDFGNGTTVTFSSATVPSLAIKSIDGDDHYIAAEDATPLSTADGSYARTCFGGVVNCDPIRMEFFYDADAVAVSGDNPRNFMPVQQTMTMIYGDGSVRSGLGQITRFTHGAQQVDEVSVGSLEWRWVTGPTYVP